MGSVWVTDSVDLPAEVIDAHAQGRLVLFVGAGASVDPPSGLPTFSDLARKLAEEARVDFSDRAAIDAFLGSMPEGFDTHRHAAAVFRREDSSPNATHAAIVELASATKPLRIVTTNFDDHLASVARARSVEVGDQWFGPALPLGDHFTGIVHLHGSACRAPDELVLTDRDFGRAYLTDAWATRFMLKVFDEFAVLFVGYSHEDPVMRYLSLGLPSQTARFALTSDPHDEKWSTLGITPIGYPTEDGDHSALASALEAWGSQARMGKEAHAERTRAIVEGGPQLNSVQKDYLVNRLRHPEGARVFASIADGVDWLSWIEGNREFTALFADARDTEVGEILGHWYCARFIQDTELHGRALQTVRRLGQQFSRSLFRSATNAAARLGQKDAEAGRRWRVFLATSVRGQTVPMNPVVAPNALGNEAGSIAVLRAALCPFLELQSPLLLPGSDDTATPGAVLGWRIDKATLSRWTRRLVTDSVAGDPTVGSLLENAMNGAYDLLADYHGGGEFDILSYRRSAIEKSTQNLGDSQIDSLIDALRDYGEKARFALPQLPERWWSFENGIFRRLALHLVAGDESRSPEERLQWILVRQLLYCSDVRHEMYSVIAATVSKAGATMREGLLRAVLAGPKLDDGASTSGLDSDYQVYNLLVWLDRHAPDWGAVKRELRRLEKEYPSFATREHPDFNRWFSRSVWVGPSEAETAGFLQAAQTDLRGAVDSLADRQHSASVTGVHSAETARSLLEGVATVRPDLGLRLWGAVDARDDIQETGLLLSGIVRGWAGADLRDLAEPIISLISSKVLHPSLSESIGEFLRKQILDFEAYREGPIPSALRELALRLWKARADEFVDPGWSDPSTLALNCWPGRLASYWLAEIDRRIRTGRGSRPKLTEVEQGALIELLQGPKPTLGATCPALARHAHFLFRADPAFSEAHVLPLFTSEHTAPSAWYTYLYYPEYDDQMLCSGLFDGIVAEWERLDLIGCDTLRGNFMALQAGILTNSVLPSDWGRILLDLSVVAADGRHSVEFASTVVRLLWRKDLSGAAAWETWLRDHIARRLDGRPREAGDPERARWVDVVPLLGDRIPEAIEAVTPYRIGFDEELFLTPVFTEIPAVHLRAVLRHVTERIEHSEPGDEPFSPTIWAMIRAVREDLGDAAATPLLNAARARGFLVDA
ncbi:MAG: SIR2 family protein [Micrococcales bacterium]|nr:SIR2 family protein [Micrococcales bacterium]